MKSEKVESLKDMYIYKEKIYIRNEINNKKG